MADSGAVDCTAIEERIEQFIDGELGRSQAAVVGAHIEGCEECTAAMVLARSIRQELRSLPQLDVSQELLREIKSVATLDPPRWRRWFEVSPVRLRLAGVAAALVLVAMLAMVLRQPFDDRLGELPTNSGETLAVEAAHGVPAAKSVGPQPSTEEVERAADEARYALAYLQRMAGKAGLAVRDEVFERNLVQPATEGLTRGLSRLRFEDDGPARGVDAGSQV